MNGPQSISPAWRWGTPQGSREFDRLLDRRLSFREKIQWLEEAETLALHIHKRREEQKLSEKNGKR